MLKKKKRVMLPTHENICDEKIAFVESVIL